MGLEAALNKLDDELKKTKGKSNEQLSPLCIAYMKKRCEEDEGLCEDVMKQEKTWEKCFEYIMRKAKRHLGGKSGAVRDDLVFEWCEEYFRRLEEPKKEKTLKEAVSKREIPKQTKEFERKEQKSIAKEKLKGKKNKKGVEGQMTIFDFLGERHGQS